MGHRLMTMPELSAEEIRRGHGQGARPPHRRRQRRGGGLPILAMLITYAAATPGRGAPTAAALPAHGSGYSEPFLGRYSHASPLDMATTGHSSAGYRGCCFVGAAAAPSPDGLLHFGNRFRFRRRPQPPSPSLSTSTSPSSSVISSASSRSSSLLMRRSLDGVGEGSRKDKGGIPFSSYNRQRPSASRYISCDTSKRRKKKLFRSDARHFPPHLAQAVGPSPFSENGELILDDDEYERRKMEWARRYTDVRTLRETFGTNQNRLWGDLDAETTRRLYHTLLPVALVGLYDMGLMRPNELAPLAYEARNAAKKYARERCVVPGRVFSMAYDGFRSLRDYGKWNSQGMSWEQIWDKYEQQIIDEFDFQDHEEDELTKQICLRILERSCTTNEIVDRLFIRDDDDAKLETEARLEMTVISAKLERDVHELLFEGAQKSIFFNPSRAERKLLKERRRQMERDDVATTNKAKQSEKGVIKALKQEEKMLLRQAKAARKARSADQRSAAKAVASPGPKDEPSEPIKLSKSEVWLLRKLIGTKRRIEGLRTQMAVIRKIHPDHRENQYDDTSRLKKKKDAANSRKAIKVDEKEAKRGRKAAKKATKKKSKKDIDAWEKNINNFHKILDQDGLIEVRNRFDEVLQDLTPPAGILTRLKKASVRCIEDNDAGRSDEVLSQ